VLLELLAASGIGRLSCDRPEAVPARLRTGRAAADGGPADVVVLVDEHTARPVVADGLLADGVVHLSVVLRDTDALVGPLVVPGRSACLRCVDRWRTDADPGWPVTREALSRGPRRPVDAATVHAVTGLAALQVLSHLDGAEPAALGASLELLLPEGRVRRRGWGPHPDCGCVNLPA
jgi:bacteriocin biosynthesis cyclodehydratase domain-containing protein